MHLKPGTKLGPYEIVGPIGAGGMGEVYRARDERLSREVAVKVLPESVARDPERLRRFEQEARATGRLNHPNILAVYDIGEHEGAPYVVEELLEGENLRHRLDTTGSLPVRKALEYARQIARGLAAAHEKGIVHRDLKPENLFITVEGRVKIFDFGLAKLTLPDVVGPVLTQAPTQVETDAGIVLGSVGYMSPEQVRGQPVDSRSDIFSLGAVLHEMLSGQRAFAADSAVETMNAILTSEPPELSQLVKDVPPDLDLIVRRCLEKNPGERFQSASDLAFQLQALSSADARSAPYPVEKWPQRRLTVRSATLVTAGILVAAAMVAAFFAGRLTRPPEAAPTYNQLTFRQGSIFSARFTPDGQSAVYAAAWEGRPRELFSTRTGSPGSRALGQTEAEILSVAPSGELAVLLEPTFTLGWVRSGTLARLPLAGGLPRQVLEDVLDADWGPDGESLAVVRPMVGRYRLEYPVGNVLTETDGWFSSVRFSRDSSHIAFLHHPVRGDNRGAVGLVDLEGTMKMLTGPFSSAGGVAWSPTGDEIWFTAGPTGNVRAIYAVDLAGNLRVVDGAPASLTLQDISPAGDVLLARNIKRRGIIGRGPGDDMERDLSYLDWSRPSDISDDGRWVLFEEQGQGGGPEYTVYLRGTDGSPPVQLGKGVSCELSPDERWALTITIDEPRRFVLLPRGPGEPRPLDIPDVTCIYGAWFPDGERLIIEATEPRHAKRLWVWSLETGSLQAVSPEGSGSHYFVSRDGAFILATGSDRRPWVFPLEGGEPRPVPGTGAEDTPVGISQDAKAVFVARRGRLPRAIERVRLDSGERAPWLGLMPADEAGLIDVDFIRLSADARSYVYSYRRVLSTLYLVEGLR